MINNNESPVFLLVYPPDGHSLLGTDITEPYFISGCINLKYVGENIQFITVHNQIIWIFFKS